MRSLQNRRLVKKFMRLALPVQVAIIGLLVIFVSSGVFASVYVLTNPGSGYDLTNGLVGYWPFTGNANDASGYGNNGTTSNVSLTTDQNGNANSAYSFNGASNSNISVANPTPNFIPSNSAPFSIGLWLKPTNVSTPTGQRMIMSNESYNTSGFRFCIDGSTKFGFWTVQSGGSINVTESTTTVGTNSWYYVTVTYDGTTLRMYVNGEYQSSNTGTIISNTNNIVFAGGAGGVDYFAGSMDEIRFYNRALGQGEITQLYTGGNSGGSSKTLNLADAQANMVGFWPFQNNALDASPRGNNGTVSGATLTTDRMGKANSAYAFNGSSNYISVADTTTLEFGSGGVTLSAWIKTSSSSGQAIIGKYAGSSTDQYYLSVNTSTVGAASFRLGSATISGGSSLNDGNWHLVTGLRRGTTGYLFVDGQQVATASMNGSATGGTSYTGIGKYGSSGTAYFNGSIDDVRIYNRGITDNEVDSLYQTYDANFSISDLQTQQVGRWRFDNNPSDATPFGNDGTWSGSGAYSLTTDRFNRSNLAYNFGGSRYLDVPDPAQFIASNNAPFSISLWFKLANLSSSDTYSLLSNEVYNSSGFRMGIYAPDAKPIFWTSEGGGTIELFNSSVTVSAGVWTNMVITYNGTTATMYINGQSVDTTTGNINAGSADLWIGRINGKDDFNGVVDDVRIWNRALSSDEAARLYTTY